MIQQSLSRRLHSIVSLGAMLLVGSGMLANTWAEEARSITQYGITWTFDKPCKVGKFVTGDYWVVGPVTVVKVDPSPGPAPENATATSQKSKYGTTAIVDDKQMRNGSMMVLGPDSLHDSKWDGFTYQGYDSRVAGNYKPELSVKFPCQLEVNRSLISTISSEKYETNKKGELALATPYVLGMAKPPFFFCNPTTGAVLDTAAVLTCLDKEPPADAFRPSYAGTEKPIYRTKDIRWDILPKLKPTPSTPDWASMERIFQRPWLDHMSCWVMQVLMPGQNQPAYGREYARMTEIAGLMLLLDVPQERKEKLMIGYIQLGIDLRGVAGAGRNWFSDGGHWVGRKLPILFAGLMLDKPELRTLPPINTKRPVFGRDIRVEPTPDLPNPTTLFSEDIDTYYGKGANGQNVLWQAGFLFTGSPPHEEKPYSEWDGGDKLRNNYRGQVATTYIGTALVAQWMKAKEIWGHDAVFDYADRWMDPKEIWYDKDGKIIPFPTWTRGTTRCQDLFVEEMWLAYRKGVPEQPGAAKNYKWEWIGDCKKGLGRWVNNPKVVRAPWGPNPTPMGSTGAAR